MGVTLDLRFIDHDRIAVRGRRAVNKAISQNDPEILRKYLATLPVDVDSSVVGTYKKRLSKLRKLKAPAIIIQNEERFLLQAKGDPYRPEAFRQSTFDELRELLGTWCWLSHTYRLDKAWHDLNWFLEPTSGPKISPLHPIWPKVGDPNQSVFTKALQGSVAYPKDDLGDPVIRTLGSDQPDCSGYNPPKTCKVILNALQRVDPDSWVKHVPFRCELYRQDELYADIDNKAIASCVANDLAFAREAFPVLLSAYEKAAEKKYGVSCEYSL
jgi:hypothetical protein